PRRRARRAAHGGGARPPRRGADAEPPGLPRLRARPAGGGRRPLRRCRGAVPPCGQARPRLHAGRRPRPAGRGRGDLRRYRRRRAGRRPRAGVPRRDEPRAAPPGPPQRHHRRGLLPGRRGRARRRHRGQHGHRRARPVARPPAPARRQPPAPMTALRLLPLLALLGVAPAAAQGFEIEFDRVPSVGQPLGIAVTIEGAEPVDGRLYFRPTGAPTYDSLVPTRTGDTFRAEIPAEALTLRGLEVYGEYVRDGETHTYPPENPAIQPIPISLFIGSAVSEVVLPPRAYRMISVPADLGETSAVRALSDDFGALGPNNWRLVRWDPAAARYVDAPEGPDSFAGGTAFWLITSRGGSFDITGAETTPAGPQPVTLEPGCNQI